MKKLYIILLFSLCILPFTFAQTIPYGMKYQAVARDLSGKILADKEISLRISLVSNSTDQVAHYSEVHNITTNQFGLFSIVVGEGTVEKGLFAEIPWSTEDIWMQVDIKTAKSSEFVTISSSKLLAVPYAFHAGTANQISGQTTTDGGGNSPGVPAQSWSLFGNSNVNPTTDFLGATNYADLVMITNNLDRLRITKDGDINIANNLDVGKNVHVGEDLIVEKNVLLNNSGGATTNKGPFTVSETSPTLLTGTLNVNGATDLDNTLNVDGTTNLNSSLDVNNGALTTLTGTLHTIGATDLDNTLNVDGATDLKSTLNTVGAATMGNSLTVAGATTLNNSLAANGQVTIDASVSGGDENYDAYPLRVQGSDQGIAIKVNGSRGGSNDFVTFFDASGVHGRIEGQTISELNDDPEYIFDNASLSLDLAIATANLAVAISNQVAADASTTAVVVGPVPGVGVTSPIPSFITSTAFAVGIAIADEVAKAANVTAYNTFRHTSIGVTYQSGAGDYAEWLPKANPAEKFFAGDVVGIKGGLIIKSTLGAEHIMVISERPIVLGNTPKAGEEANYEKVAFMGQVPVKVFGKVEPGDYILAHTEVNGVGIGRKPSDMLVADYKRIIGIAWSASDRAGLNHVNTAVGINTNDMAHLFTQQEEKISAQAAEIITLRNQINQTNATLAQLLPGFGEKMGIAGAPVVTAIPSPQNKSANQTKNRVKLPELSVAQLEQGLALAEKSLRESGADVKKLIVFDKIAADPAYKAQLFAKLQQQYNRQARDFNANNSQK